MVAEIIEQKKNEIAALCREQGIQKLDALFLADLGDPDDRLFDRYIDFVLELEKMLDREVFLVSDACPVTTPHRAQWIEESRVTVYES